jgi:Nucleotidyl transferase AbiEii toxin, Type IV TA system
LKGGTALNVFHSDLDRLSVDIDVNYVGAIEKERMDADRPGLEDQITRLMESKGYAARREPSEHAGANGSTAMPPRWVGRGPSRSISIISTAASCTA